jgi:flagellar protein FlaG
LIEKLLNQNQPTDYQVKPIEKTPSVNKISAEQTHESPQKPPSKEKTEEVVNSMNEFLKASNTHLKFEFHEELQEYYVAIVDERTNEVVKEIPSKKLLDMYAAMTEYVGLMVDKKA